ncbi:hypothetical protein IMSAGC009_03837 [Lachnospiraceae bacterium]|nr:hypothetical protein IMSAGC009_03837 [Lachnospiraceae bacterium]
MPLELFKNLTTEADSVGIGALTLASRGEPLLHPDIIEMLDHVKDMFIEKKINTNATRLDREVGRKILESGFNHIVFSCDSHIKEEYEELRVGGVFEEVLKNISEFWDLRCSKEFKELPIRVSISGVKMRQTQDEEEFSKFWGKYCDDAYMLPAEERWDTYNNKPHSDLVQSCVYPWERMYIWHDGTINPCDVDYKSALSGGKYQDLGSIHNAWASLEKIRLTHINGDRACLVPCDRCGVSHPRR